MSLCNKYLKGLEIRTSTGYLSSKVFCITLHSSQDTELTWVFNQQMKPCGNCTANTQLNTIQILQKKEIAISVTTLMNLENITLGEISNTQSDKYSINLTPMQIMERLNSCKQSRIVVTIDSGRGIKKCFLCICSRLFLWLTIFKQIWDQPLCFWSVSSVP